MHQGRLLALIGALLVGVLIPGQPTAPTSAAPSRATLMSPSSSSSAWQPERDMHRGLHLLPGTKAIDYGPLAPYDIGDGRVITFPSSADLSQWDMPVGDQGYIGSCTSWAATYSLAGWYLNKEGHGDLGPLAPMETYQQVNGGVDQGSWAYLNLDADAQGMVPLALYPQGNYDWKTPATGTEEARGAGYRMVGAMGIYEQPAAYPSYDGTPQPKPSRDELMRDVRIPLEYALAHGHPAILELSVYENMYDATPQTAWVGPVDTATDVPLGGHDLIAVKYDQYGVWVENQWGTGWGINGYAELSWDYVLDAVMAAYTIDGVTVPAHPYKAPVYRGTPAISLSFVDDGVPVSGKTWKSGTEMVLSGKGFTPGEDVALSFDGTYRSYARAWANGTWQVEWYQHWGDPTGPHNTHPAPGLHTIRAAGERGDYAWRSVEAN